MWKGLPMRLLALAASLALVAGCSGQVADEPQTDGPRTDPPPRE
ncbi:MAG: hypothetical protein K0S65_4071, partial [Labilithrix sp.]|nr:hypothetical protein [Labilithrix sp.]